MYHLDQLGKQISEADEVMDYWIKQLGLSYNHFAVLYSLAKAPEGSCTQKNICDEWLIPKQTVFNVCKEYKEKGWVVFSDSPTDKRERIITLTDIGKMQAQPVLYATRTLSKQTFDALGQEKTQQLFALLAEFCTTCRQQIDQITLDKHA